MTTPNRHSPRVERDMDRGIQLRLVQAKLDCALADVRWCLEHGMMAEVFQASARSAENHLLVLASRAAQ